MPWRGQKGLKLTEETKQKISKSLKKYYETHDGPWKNVKRNQEFKNSVSRTLKRLYRNGHTNWNKGKHLTQEHKNNILLGHIGRKHSQEPI
jgi:hypothetical protein